MDDESLVRSTAHQMLAFLGYEVESTDNGYRAISLYEAAMTSSVPFDAVILDLTIPGSLGGKDTMKQLIQIDPDIKAIVASGYSNDPVLSNFNHWGFKAAVSKPYNLNEISKVISGVLLR